MEPLHRWCDSPIRAFMVIVRLPVDRMSQRSLPTTSHPALPTLPSSMRAAASSSTPSQRAHAWCQLMVQLWEKRDTATGDALALEVSLQIARAAQGVLAASGASTTSTATTTSQVAMSVLHQHSHELLRVTEEAVTMWLKRAPSLETAASLNKTFVLAPASMHLLLRLVVLLCQRLPAHYSKAWSAANPLPTPGSKHDSDTDDKQQPLTKKPIPVPQGLEVSTFQAWFLRVHHLGMSLLSEVLRPERKRTPWDARFGALALHLEVLARFHAPTVVEVVVAKEQFWSRLETVLANTWFASNLTQYEGMRDVLQSMITLLVTDGDAARLRRVTVQILRAFRIDPIPAPQPNSTLAASLTHLLDSRVGKTPPGITQHEGMMSFLVLTVQGHMETEKNATSEQSTSASDPFLLALLQELHEQFTLAIAVPAESTKSSFHRSAMPVFGVIGVLQAIDSADAVSSTDIDASEKQFASVYARAKKELQRMISVLFSTPDVRSLYEQFRSTSSSPSTLRSSSWPCTNTLGVCCNSCLFTLVVSSACVFAAKWISIDDTKHGALKSATTDRSLLLFSTTLVAHTFLHLIDTTWVLNGSIEVAPELSVGTEEQSCRGSSAGVPDQAAVVSPPPKPSPSVTSPPRLLAWLSSPLYALLPHYTRAFSLLFLRLRDREEEQRVLGCVWRRIKYNHAVWRWYSLYGGGAGALSVSDSAATTFAAGDLTRQGLNDAMERARQAAGEMNEVATTAANLPSAPSLSSPTSSVRVSPSSIRLHRTTLRRAHSGLYLAVIMFLGAILRSGEWRGGMLQEESEIHGDDLVHLSPLSRRHSFSIALVIDMLSHLEFLAGTVIASGAGVNAAAGGVGEQGRTAFAPYKEVLEIVLALVTGREIYDSATRTPPSKTSAFDSSPYQLARRMHRATLYRDAFARETMAMYIRCFFEPASQGGCERNSILLSPTLGLESMASHLLKASKQSPSVALPYLLAASGLPFVPTILADSSLQLPDPLKTVWPAVPSKFTIAPSNSGSNSPGSFDSVTMSRQYFLAGLFTGTSSLLPYSLCFHYLLPFLFSLATTQGKRLKGVKRRGLQGVCQVVKRGFQIATNGADNADADDDGSSMFPGLTAAPTGACLERFLRQLLPFLLSHTLASFPHYAGFQQVMEVHLCMFACVPSNDVLLLHSLQLLLSKASGSLVSLMQNEARLKRWKQVTDLAGKAMETEPTEEDDYGRVSEEEEEEDFQVFGIPKNVRLPQKFPSLTSVRKLLLLHLQLMQSLDASLYAGALSQLEYLFTQTLDPRVYPVATPLRASLSAMVHESLVRGFDLSKRDATAEWFVRLVEKLNIPVGIQAKDPSPQLLLTTGSSSHSSLVDAVKKAEQTRPGRMIASNRTMGGRSTASTNYPAEVVPPAPRLVCVEGLRNRQ